MHRYRTHRCSELRAADIGQSVRLSGFVHRKRDHGGLVFVDLRDHDGITQCVGDPADSSFAQMEGLHAEDVVCIDGEVAHRPKDTENPDLATGAVEVHVHKLDILSRAKTLPVPVFGEPDYPEDMRLAWRFLDLRRPTLHARIMTRAQITSWLRRRMEADGFTEFQTPILTASSPEGARDFLVPSRLQPGHFYALPQAPQLFKQLIMASGFDRYFQIAPCFRDEDARADRSPGEFYQLDMEMSFVEQEDVLQAMEPVLHDLFTHFAPKGMRVQPMPFPRIPFGEAMLNYGTDKPDLRNPLKICDVSDLFADPSVSFRAFRGVIEKGGVVRAIPAPGAGARPRAFFDGLNGWAQTEMNAPGLGYIIFEGDAAKGPIGKFLPPPIIAQMAKRAGLTEGDALFFACAPEKEAARLAGAARTQIATQLNLVPEGEFAFCWIVDMPMFELDDTGNIIFSHNPFSMPQGGLEALQTKDPLDILGFQYDIVCNGVELSSGAIRAHDPEILFKAFEIAGYARAEVEARFPALLRALSCGVPPHGGIAPGLDRIAMLLCGADNLRDVVMFPMNQQGEDLLMGAPAQIEAERLRALHLRALPPKTPKKTDDA